MAIIDAAGLDLFYALVKKENPTLPTVVDKTTTMLVDGSELPDGRFKATLVGIYGAGWKGKLDVVYKRLDIAKLLNPAVTVNAVAPVSVYELFEDIYRNVGIRFGEGDVQDAPAGSSMPYTVRLKAKPTSALYYGEVDITVDVRIPYLDEVLESGDYDSVMTELDPTALPVEFITYSNDYTSIASNIDYHPQPFIANDVLADDARTQQLMAAMTTVDGLPWGVDAQWTLVGGTVLYHGDVATAPTEYGQGKSFERILAVRTANDHLVYAYYNNWSNPQAWEVA